jgi:DNA-binding transcriptional ArsR family regulator
MKRAARKVPRSLDAAPAFAALGDATRLRIVTDLCKRGPMSIARLTEGAAVTRQAVTKHLRALEEAGLVRPRGEGRERVWELRTARLQEVKRYLDGISSQWDSALRRLRAFVEDGR